MLPRPRPLLQRARCEGQDCCFLPGGGRHPGETLGSTVRREVHEETGLDVTPQRLLWLREYVGSRHGGAPEDHRVEAIFPCRPEGDPESSAATPQTTCRPAWNGWSWRR
ncbi:NUDIX domain-containing protein [Streptomyces antibioticus]|uniref:NUDIX domain-containing protein n=1 Tax=Streptomyces antibioticus TaxID=1890 RepID=UPI003D723F20